MVAQRLVRQKLSLQQKHGAKGFTLLEMLAAIAIFSVVTLSAWQIFQGVVAAHDIVVSRNERMQQLQYALLLIDQDLQQLADRGPRSGDGVNSAGLFSGEDMLETEDEALATVRYGWHNPQHILPRSELQRVFYRLYEGRLERQFHYVLDTQEVDAEPVTQTLLDGVTTLKFEFYHDDKWQKDLPESGVLPKAIAMAFTLEGIGLIERKYLVPAFWQAEETTDSTKNSGTGDTNEQAR